MEAVKKATRLQFSLHHTFKVEDIKNLNCLLFLVQIKKTKKNPDGTFFSVMCYAVTSGDYFVGYGQKSSEFATFTLKLPHRKRNNIFSHLYQ